MGFVALDTQQLNTLAKQDPYLKWVYDGTFPCDVLPRFPNKHHPTAYIVNTDPAGQPGHIGLPYGRKITCVKSWIAMGYPLNGMDPPNRL